MSHISQIAIEVKDIDALEIACRERGVELRREQKTFRTFRGAQTKCDMAIVDPTNNRAYEIGVVLGKDGVYKLQTDEWQGGLGMNEKVGDRAGLLLQRYGLNVAKRQAAKQGWAANEQRLPDGSIRLVCEPKQQYATAGAGGWGGSGY